VFLRVCLILLLLNAAACNLESTDDNAPEDDTTITATPEEAPTALQRSTSAIGETPDPTKVSETGCPIPDRWVEYRVRPGDTLTGIANLFDMTVAELTTANCIEDADAIDVDQLLYVPPGSSAGSGDSVRMYLIGLGNDGLNGLPAGCDYNAVLQETPIVPSQDTATELLNVLRTMLSFDNGVTFQSQSGLLNAFVDQNITVRDVSVSGGQALIRFDGNLTLTGVCADALMANQLLLNVFKYDEIDSAMITVGGQNLKQLFDGSGTQPANAVFTREDLASSG